jgi:hypothetical protein
METDEKMLSKGWRNLVAFAALTEGFGEIVKLYKDEKAWTRAVKEKSAAADEADARKADAEKAVEAANIQAAEIVAKAKAEAAAIIEEVCAERDATKAKIEAKIAEADEYAERRVAAAEIECDDKLRTAVSNAIASLTTGVKH